MTTQENNKEIIRRSYELFNEKDLDALSMLYSPDFTEHSPAPGRATGIEGLKQFWRAAFKALPDARVTIEDIVAEEDRVAIRAIISGMQRGSFLGISPTNKKVSFAEIDIFRVVDGKITDHWGLYDSLGLLEQLGVVLPPKAA